MSSYSPVSSLRMIWTELMQFKRNQETEAKSLILPENVKKDDQSHFFLFLPLNLSFVKNILLMQVSLCPSFLSTTLPVLFFTNKSDLSGSFCSFVQNRMFYDSCKRKMNKLLTSAGPTFIIKGYKNNQGPFFNLHSNIVLSAGHNMIYHEIYLPLGGFIPPVSLPYCLLALCVVHAVILVMLRLCDSHPSFVLCGCPYVGSLCLHPLCLSFISH